MGNAMIFGGARMTVPVNGIPLSDFPEGQIVMIPENNVLTPFYLAKHNYESGLNGTGRTLMVRKDVHSNRAWNSTNNAMLDGSAIDLWLNGDYKALLDVTVQEAIGTTKFYYTYASGSSSYVTTLERAVFLLSLTELNKTESYAKTEGSALPIASTLEIAYLNGTATTQWTRTPDTRTPFDSSFGLSNSGTVSNYYCNSSRGVRPCFALPSTMLVNPEPNADGSVNLMC